MQVYDRWVRADTGSGSVSEPLCYRSVCGGQALTRSKCAKSHTNYHMSNHIEKRKDRKTEQKRTET